MSSFQNDQRLPWARFGMAAAVMPEDGGQLGSRFMVMGGAVDNVSQPLGVSNVAVHTESTPAWQPLDNWQLHSPRVHHAAAVLDGQIYIVGGEHAGKRMNTVEVFQNNYKWSATVGDASFALSV